MDQLVLRNYKEKMKKKKRDTEGKVSEVTVHESSRRTRRKFLGSSF